MSGLRITWLGQAGFAIAEPDGGLCLIDPYLSDSGRNEANNPRIAPIVLDPGATAATAVVTSHWHQDHLDRETSEALLRANADAVFVGPPANLSRLEHWRFPARNQAALRRGGRVDIGPFAIQGHFARHEVPGWICEDAVSIVIEVAGVRIYHSGDTEYDARLREVVTGGAIDVGLFAINGTGGNMNAFEAALLAYQLRPRVAIPMHYGMWTDEKYGGLSPLDVSRQTLDPNVFAETYRRLGGGRSLILQLGESVTLDSSDIRL
jgi:L-ascorbate metabolism protein UlaG (beta-lactamase superfamily)